MFKTQCVPYSPKRRQRTPIRKHIRSPEGVQARDSSSDSSFEPIPLTMKAIFERFKKKKPKKRKYKRTGRPRGRPQGKKSSRSSQRSKIEFKDKGSGFPFLESENGRKQLPWRKILTFEVSILYVQLCTANMSEEFRCSQNVETATLVITAEVHLRATPSFSSNLPWACGWNLHWYIH